MQEKQGKETTLLCLENEVLLEIITPHTSWLKYKL